MIPRSISHAALCVRGFDRSMHFYLDLLGLEVSQEGTNAEAGEYQQGIYERINRKLRFVILCARKANPGPLSFPRLVIPLH